MRSPSRINCSVSLTMETKSVLPAKISASGREFSKVSGFGAACTIQPVRMTADPGCSLRNFRTVCRVLRSLSAVTVQELTTTASNGAVAGTATCPAAAKASRRASVST